MSLESMGKRFGRPDIERIGLFSEMPYMNGKGYVPPGRPIYFKGANFLNSGPKTKDGTQDGYFDDEFRRLYVGEAIARKPKTAKAKTPLLPFIINSVPKKHSTPGDNYGTFTTHLDAFSAKREKAKFVHEPINFLWRSGKIGGPGYADTGLDKYPEHLPDRYGLKPSTKEFGKILNGPFLNAVYPQPYFENNPFKEEPLPSVGIYLDRELRKKGNVSNEPWMPTGPGKWDGGSHAGCFTPFPEFMPCKYVSMWQANQPAQRAKQETAFIPIPLVPKSGYTNSIVDQTVDVFMNTENRKTYVPCYVDRLLTDWYS